MQKYVQTSKLYETNSNVTTLTSTKYNSFMHANMVLFYQECSDGRYGFDCSSVCGRCINYDPCNKTNGVCLNGCAEGFTGELRLTSGKLLH